MTDLISVQAVLNAARTADTDAQASRIAHHKAYLRVQLGQMQLFSGLPDFMLQELVTQFWDRFELFDFKTARQQARTARAVRSVCELPLNDRVIFAVHGDLLVFSEVEQRGPGVSPGDEKTTATLIKVLRAGQHFGDSFYANLDSIKGAFQAKLQTRDRQAEWIAINRHDLEDALQVLSPREWLENAYEQKADDYQDLVFRIQQGKEASVYDRLRYFIQLYSQQRRFDLRTFNQQVIADAIQCDRTAVNKELKALQRLSSAELGIRVQDKVLCFHCLPEMSPTLPLYQRFVLFAQGAARPLSATEQQRLTGRNAGTPLWRLSLDEVGCADLLAQAGIGAQPLARLLTRLQAEASPQNALQLLEDAGRRMLIFHQLPARLRIA